MSEQLPEFVCTHQLVEFHRGETATESLLARASMSAELSEVQEIFEAMNVSGGDYPTDDVVVAHDSSTADGVTSWDQSIPVGGEHGDFMHRPTLDIDFPAALVPSSTPGHFHLYLDKLMTWEKYSALLSALADAGIIEPGYNLASQQRGYSAVRLPWVKK